MNTVVPTAVTSAGMALETPRREFRSTGPAALPYVELRPLTIDLSRLVASRPSVASGSVTTASPHVGCNGCHP